MVSTNEDDQEQIDDEIPLPVSRRVALGGISGGIIGVLAGCTGQEGGGTPTPTTPTDTPTEGEDETPTDTPVGEDGKTPTPTDTPTETATDTATATPVEEKKALVYRAPHGNYEAELNFNPWNPKTYSTNKAQSWFGFRDNHQTEWVSDKLGGPITNVTVSRGNEAVFTLVDGLKWQNGEDYVAEDLALHFRLVKHVFGESADPWPLINKVIARSDREFVFDLATDAAWPIVRSSFWRAGGIAPATARHTFKKFLERFKDATTDKKTQQVKNDLLELKIGVDELPPPNGFTAWKPTEVRERLIVNELWEEHPFAERINFTKCYGLNLNLAKQQGLQMIQAGDLDALRKPLSKSTVKEFKQNDKFRVDSKFELQTTALLFNHEQEMLSKPNIRRGIGYLLNRNRLAKLIFPPKPAPVSIPVPFQRTMIDPYLGKTQNKFLNYGTNPQKGANFLKAAGASKQGGEWIRPDGRPFDLQLVSPPAPLLDRGSSAVSRELKRVGIGHTIVDKPGSYMWSKGYPQAGYDLVVGPWVFGEHPIPCMKVAFIDQNFPHINLPDKITYPSEIGNLDSEKTTISPKKALSGLPSKSKQKRRQMIKKLAWVYNSQLVAYDISQKFFHNTWRVDDWEYPPLDTLGMGVEQVAKHGVKGGLVKAK